MNLYNFYYLEYSYYCLNLYCYIHNVSADAFINLLQVFLVELGSSFTEVVLSQTIHFITSTQFSGTPYSPKLKHYRNLTIILFSIISKTLVGGVLLLCRGAVGVFCSPNQLGHRLLGILFHWLTTLW